MKDPSFRSRLVAIAAVVLILLLAARAAVASDTHGQSVVASGAAVVVVGVAILLSGAAVPAPSATVAGSKECVDLSRVVAIHFWPHGHHAIPRIDAPDYPIPHAEVYGSSIAGYPPASEIVVISAKKVVFRTCFRRRSDTTDSRLVRVRTTRAKSVVTCTIPRGAVVQVRRSSRGATLRILERPSKLLVRADFTTRGGSLSYTTRQCRRTKALDSS